MKEILDLMFLEIFRLYYQTTEHIMLLCHNIYHNSSGYSFEYGTTCTINPYLGLRKILNGRNKFKLCICTQCMK